MGAKQVLEETFFDKNPRGAGIDSAIPGLRLTTAGGKRYERHQVGSLRLSDRRWCFLCARKACSRGMSAVTKEKAKGVSVCSSALLGFVRQKEHRR